MPSKHLLHSKTSADLDHRRAACVLRGQRRSVHPSEDEDEDEAWNGASVRGAPGWKGEGRGLWSFGRRRGTDEVKLEDVPLCTIERWHKCPSVVVWTSKQTSWGASAIYNTLKAL